LLWLSKEDDGKLLFLVDDYIDWQFFLRFQEQHGLLG